MVVGESRTELLNWLNNTLDLQYNKVEQCGTGAAYCQLLDCIMGGVPMGKVKFDALTEYDYLHNFKILQAGFNKHKINKTMDVGRLVKCRLLDNLELLQWFKKFWHENKFVNEDYDPVSRRKSSSGGMDTRARLNASRSRTPSSSSLSLQRPNPPTTRVASNGRSLLPPNTQAGGAKIVQLTKEIADTRSELSIALQDLGASKIQAESLETERNFYFNKLREIEILIENLKLLDEPEFSKVSKLELIDKIQLILYSTEEGFQANDEQADIEADEF